MTALSIRNMNFTVGNRELLEANRSMKESDWGDLMDALRWLDPEGWSDWYDETLPDWKGWNNAPFGLLRARVNYLIDLYLGGVDVEAFHTLIIQLVS